mgnify:CR=1 FL=1
MRISSTLSRTLTLALAALAVALLVAGTVAAQNGWSISWWTVDAGGGATLWLKQLTSIHGSRDAG